MTKTKYERIEKLSLDEKTQLRKEFGKILMSKVGFSLNEIKASLSDINEDKLALLYDSDQAYFSRLSDSFLEGEEMDLLLSLASRLFIMNELLVFEDNLSMIENDEIYRVLKAQKAIPDPMYFPKNGLLANAPWFQLKNEK